LIGESVPLRFGSIGWEVVPFPLRRYVDKRRPYRDFAIQRNTAGVLMVFTRDPFSSYALKPQPFHRVQKSHWPFCANHLFGRQFHLNFRLAMAFTESEITEQMEVLEIAFWSRRRPPLHLRDNIREGQRFTDQSIELFFARPAFERPGKLFEESIAKIKFVRSRNVWRIFWKRASGKWAGYKPCAETSSLSDALRVIDGDDYSCFFG
jgi:hypothetical protein